MALRTFARDLANHLAWRTIGGENLDNAKYYMNCILKPLLGEDSPDVPFLLLMPPPQLHLFLVLNHLLEQLGKMWEGLAEWLKKLHVVFAPYHGVTLEGNECATVLRHAEELAQAVPDHLTYFTKVILAMKAVVRSAFGYNTIATWREDINKMKEAFESLNLTYGVSETVKLHIIFEHIPQLLERSAGRGLAQYSEQVTEASHHSFKKTWEKFRVKDLEAPMYLERYLKAVLYHNFTHI